jgi:hypothetical protein
VRLRALLLLKSARGRIDERSGASACLDATAPDDGGVAMLRRWCASQSENGDCAMRSNSAPGRSSEQLRALLRCDAARSMAIWARQMQGLVLLQPEQLAADDALGTVTEDDEVRCMLQDSGEKEEAVAGKDDKRAAVATREQRLMRT